MYKNSNIFVVYIIVLKFKLSIYLIQVAQVAAPQLDKAFTKILAEYSSYVDIFFSI